MKAYGYFDVNPSTLVGISNKKLSRYPNCSPKCSDQSHSTQSLLLVVSCRLEGTKEAKVITLDPNTTSEPIQVDAHFWGRQKVPCFFRVFFNDPLNKMWGWTDGHFGDIFGMVILDQKKQVLRLLWNCSTYSLGCPPSQ